MNSERTTEDEMDHILELSSLSLIYLSDARGCRTQKTFPKHLYAKRFASRSIFSTSANKVTTFNWLTLLRLPFYR